MLTYKNTMVSCFIGYIVQAIVNNFIPLLFVTFQNTYGIPLAKITMLITFNFTVQILTDLVAAKYVDKIGYRAAMVLAHVFSALGLAGLTVLPELLDPFGGILLAVTLYAVGGGLLRVLDALAQIREDPVVVAVLNEQADRRAAVGRLVLGIAIPIIESPEGKNDLLRKIQIQIVLAHGVSSVRASFSMACL